MVQARGKASVYAGRAVIEVRELSKSFPGAKGGTVQAVESVSFNVGFGEVFGLLGPNGAGKTTTLRMLATLLRPSSGTAGVNGFDIVRVEAKSVQPVNEVRGSIFEELRQAHIGDRLSSLRQRFRPEVKDPAFFAGPGGSVSPPVPPALPK